MRCLPPLALLLTVLAVPSHGADAPAPPPAARALTVRVTHTGQPVKGAKVFLKNSMETESGSENIPVTPILTDAKGEASTTTKGARAMILVLSPDFAPSQKIIELPAPENRVEFALEVGQPRRLRVVSREGGAAVPNTPLMFSSFPSVHGFWVLQLSEKPSIGVTDKDGFLTWPHAPRGSVIIDFPSVTGSFGSFFWDDNEPDKKVRILTEIE